MGRIEDIKERWKDFKADDVHYLLSRLQIAEEALDDIANNSERAYTLTGVERKAREALEQIRRD